MWCISLSRERLDFVICNICNILLTDFDASYWEVDVLIMIYEELTVVIIVNQPESAGAGVMINHDKKS